METAPQPKQPLTVKALTKYIKLKFDSDTNLQDLLLKGELSNFKRHSRGHFYFTLKDDGAQISGVMFATAAKRVAFSPREGMQVIVKGHITVYEASGTYTLYVKEMEEDGIGNLYLAFNQLKERLGREGLFDAVHKKPLPKFPKAVGVITSPTGAAVRDVLTTLRRRYPGAKVYIYPALVQGEGAAPSLVKCIRQANEMGAADVLIIGRGGGSIEDLWAFNEEAVARAIFASALPVISAVGHETDFTIADFAADMRAPTPTAAAELAVPSRSDVLMYVNQLNGRLIHNFSVLLDRKRQRLLNVSSHYMLKNPQALFEQRLLRVSQLGDRLQFALQARLAEGRQRLLGTDQVLGRAHPGGRLGLAGQRLEFLTRALNQASVQNISNVKNRYAMNLDKLEMLNPLAVLKKGYSVVKDEKGRTVRDASELALGQQIQATLGAGTFTAKVETINRGEMYE